MIDSWLMIDDHNRLFFHESNLVTLDGFDFILRRSILRDIFLRHSPHCASFEPCWCFLCRPPFPSITFTQKIIWTPPQFSRGCWCLFAISDSVWLPEDIVAGVFWLEDLDGCIPIVIRVIRGDQNREILSPACWWLRGVSQTYGEYHVV